MRCRLRICIITDCLPRCHVVGCSVEGSSFLVWTPCVSRALRGPPWNGALMIAQVAFSLQLRVQRKALGKVGDCSREFTHIGQPRSIHQGTKPPLDWSRCPKAPGHPAGWAGSGTEWPCVELCPGSPWSRGHGGGRAMRAPCLPPITMRSSPQQAHPALPEVVVESVYPGLCAVCVCVASRFTRAHRRLLLLARPLCLSPPLPGPQLLCRT